MSERVNEQTRQIYLQRSKTAETESRGKKGSIGEIYTKTLVYTFLPFPLNFLLILRLMCTGADCR